MGCDPTTHKISYIIFNVILAIFATTVIVYTAINPEEETAVTVFIVCGLIVIFAVLGAFAAIRESISLTATCAAFLLLLAILQIACVCYYSSISKSVGIKTLERAWLNDDMKDIEIEFKCCGVMGAEDYVLFNKPIPLSCYEFQQSNALELLFHDGCSAKLQDYYDREMLAYWIGNGFLIVLETIGFLLALFLVIIFRNKQLRSQF